MPVFITTVHTRLPASEVNRRLGGIIEERTGWAAGLNGARIPGRTGAPFAGSRDDATFKVVRLIRYRNSFLPVIRGRIVPGGMGADVRLVMTLHPIVAVFLLLWCAGLVFGVARGFTQSVAPMLALGPLAICSFGLFVTAAGFFPEALKARQLICAALRTPAG